MANLYNQSSVFTIQKQELTPDSSLIKVTQWRHSLTATFSVPFHSHQFIEIVIVTDGSAIHHISNADGDMFTARLTKGDIIFINPGDIHTYYFETDEYLDVINIIINPIALDGDYLSRYYSQETSSYFCTNCHMELSKRLSQTMHLNDSELSVLLELVYQLQKLSEESSTLSPKKTELQLAIILYEFEELYRQREHSGVAVEQVDVGIGGAILFIQSHYCEQIMVEDVVKHSCCSRRKLERAFKRLTNETVVENINRLRINKACQLLLETDMKITDIVLNIGMNNMSYFNRLFKARVGTTPRDFRAIHSA